ncbi:MAG: hypothetical protein MdMp014T_1959 [Treponematales bacterium]
MPVKTILVRKPCWGSPEALEKEVLRCVLADHAGTPLPGTIAPYWRAFKNEFTLGTPFTLYSPFVNQVHLYVYEENCNTSGIPRERFFAQCGVIIGRLTEIAKAAIRLGEKGCVEFEFCGPRKPQLPPDFKTNWRKFENIRRRDELLYLMSVDIVPTPELYRI